MEFWVLLVAIVINIALALVISTRGTRASSAAYFGISTLFIAFWAFGVILMLYGGSQAAVQIGLLLFLIAPMITSHYMVLFSKHFSGVDFPKKYAAIGLYVGMLVVFAAATLAALPQSNAIVSIGGAAGNELNFQGGWFLVYGAYIALSFLFSYAYLLTGASRSRGRIHKHRRLVLAGVFATSILAIVTNIVLPYIGYLDLIWLGPVWAFFYIITGCYAMVKHGLFDLRLAMVLTFTYTLSLATLTVLYYLIAATVSVLFIKDIPPQLFSGVDVVVALLLVLVFQPIRRFFIKVTRDVFYQNNYKVDEFFSELNGILTSTNDLRLLLKRASEKISETLKSADVSFVISSEDTGFEQIGSGKFSRVSRKEVEWLDKYFDSSPEMSAILAMLDDDDERLRRLMVSHRAAIIIPLVRQDIKMGYLIFGENRRGSYSAQDYRVAKALGDELEIAIQNALSVEEVKQLNNHLEQRIDSATKELRRTNAQLQKLDEAKDEFISMASHQLRTPLTSIKGYLSMLIEGDVGEVSKEQKRILREVFVSSERMVRLIGDFLNVSRLQTGKFVIEKRPVDLARLVQREVDGLASNAAARNIQFVYKKPKNIPELQLDENKIQQVVMNFADNAIFYSKEESKITVSLKKVGDFVEFKVIDKGIGVPEAEQERLFNKFFRATNARKARPDGTGVGLFLAKKVVNDHGGTIIFESKEGKGSTFGFQLPLPKK